MERNIKNAAEFALFIDRFVRVWDTEVTDWIPGKIVESNQESITMEITQGNKNSAITELKTIPYVRIAKAKLLQI